MEAAIQAGGVEAIEAYYHKDFDMKMDSNGANMTKEEWKEGATSIFKHSYLEREDSRCIYENDKILVSNEIMTFPNGSKDAGMWFATKKDRLPHRVETGSTPLSI